MGRRGNTVGGRILIDPEGPFCVDCRHCIDADNPDERSQMQHRLRCQNPKAIRDAVTGLGGPCHLIRWNEHNCGPDGEWFEAKQED